MKEKTLTPGTARGIAKRIEKAAQEMFATQPLVNAGHVLPGIRRPRKGSREERAERLIGPRPGQNP